ncbi:hypothetical protein EVAR_12919_1 [Eumeta japonica]|uniref:Uncharacterized protein n=1 Tax=Eumeta variegata TaxID=151549 RepID=A0A4C1TW47_EUMVA|nr:hypothetical protein EVAR_12919_1 [Eumeta japonica]
MLTGRPNDAAHRITLANSAESDRDAPSLHRAAPAARPANRSVAFSPCKRGGEEGEKPIMGRLCTRAHGCVRLSRAKNLLNNLFLRWRKQNAMMPSSKTRPFRHSDVVGARLPYGCLLGGHLGIGGHVMFTD